MEDVDATRARLEVRNGWGRHAPISPQRLSFPAAVFLISFVSQKKKTSQAALHMAATAPATTTKPVDALVSTLASTCPALVADKDGTPTLHLPSASARALFDASLRSSLAGLAADAADAGTPIMEHVPAGGGGAPALPRLLDLALELGGSGAVDQGEDVRACFFSLLRPTSSLSIKKLTHAIRSILHSPSHRPGSH